MSSTELTIVIMILGVGSLFVFPMVGIPRALRRVSQRTRSRRGPVIGGLGLVVGTLALVTGALNGFFALMMLALNGCWLFAALWANSKSEPPAKGVSPRPLRLER
jgi:hypothetical protein